MILGHIEKYSRRFLSRAVLTVFTCDDYIIDQEAMADSVETENIIEIER